ncbi:MAG: phospholipid carrier-dependent glycosyltransferase [Nitrospirota bacterium]
MNETLTNNSIYIKSWKLAILVLILAAVFRLWGTFDLSEYRDDEFLHATYAKSLGAYGTTTNWGWHHPQLSGLIMYGTIKLFGDNPVGWRSSNIFFGTASVILLFLIGRMLYPGTAVPIIAMSLLAFDPHNIYISRTTLVEIPVTFFFLLYLCLLLEYVENNRATLPFAGLAMGLTMGTKAYFVFAIPLSVMYALYRIRRRGELTRAVMADFLIALLMLPFAVYFLTYVQWFSRGYTLPEFIQMNIDSAWALQKLSMDNFFMHRDFLEAGGTPVEWFVKPMFWGYQRLLNSEAGQFLLHCNNPPFRLLVLPALFAVSLNAWMKRSVREFLAPLLFISCYLLILLAQRPIFSYSSTGLLPFAYLALARTVTIFAVKINREKVVYACFISAILIWGTYMFPLVSARLVPLTPFRPILSMVRYMGNF